MIWTVINGVLVGLLLGTYVQMVRERRRAEIRGVSVLEDRIIVHPGGVIRAGKEPIEIKPCLPPMQAETIGYKVITDKRGGA